jgi:hypothetical protein
MMVHVFGHVATLRRRRIKPAAISLFGLHGEVAFNEYDAKAGDRMPSPGAASAQVVVMLLAVAANIFIPFRKSFALLVWGPCISFRVQHPALIVALLPSDRSMATVENHPRMQVVGVRVAAKRAPAPARNPSPVHAEEQRARRSSQRTAAERFRACRATDAPTQDR